MDTQFQLGLELTNILNPLTSAVSALGSLALAKAIKKGGSDVLTELELAKVLGRNSIEPGILLNFREIVARSGHAPLSRYVDIILDSGAGPTVRNALQNPELLAMVIQLSALCSMHEIDSLAHAIVEAMERNAKELKAGLDDVPDYLSLCGTLRVCKEDTIGFRWCDFYDAVERRIESSFDDVRSRKRSRINSTSWESARSADLKRPSIAIRILPFPVLQVLLMSIHTIQHFPEERILHIECTTGISSIIVWCYYILDLNVKLTFHGREIVFGKPSTNVFVRESPSKESFASLLHPNCQHEPLFTLSSGEGDPVLTPELRKPLRGFGRDMISQLGVDGENLDNYAKWVICQSIRVLSARTELKARLIPGQSLSKLRHSSAEWSNAETCGFTENKIISASTLLFDCVLAGEENFSDPDNCSAPLKRHTLDLSSLVVLLLALARVQPEDLVNCSDLPLSVPVQQQMRHGEPHVRAIADGSLREVEISLTTSFDVLSRFLQGSTFSRQRNQCSILVSACGWSIYFDSINGDDPAYTFASTLRVVRGIPTRDGVRRTRIVDGPTQLLFSPSDPIKLKTKWKRLMEIFPGVGVASRERALIGFQGSDAFQITQAFEWPYQGTIPRRHLLGFREMLDISQKFYQLSPCDCDSGPSDLQSVLEPFITCDDTLGEKTLFPKNDTLRTLFCLENGQVDVYSNRDSITRAPDREKSFTEWVFTRHSILECRQSFEAWLFYVSHKPASRWMQMSDMYPSLVTNCGKESLLLLRSPDTCLHCAFDVMNIFKDCIPCLPSSIPQAGHEVEHPTLFVLL